MSETFPSVASAVDTGCSCGLCAKEGPHVHKRTPIVRFEIQLWPPPPVDARPHWCYIRTLIFYDAEWKKVWEREFPELDNLRDRDGYARARVELDTRGFGWILVLEADHEIARKVLAKVGLPEIPGIVDRCHVKPCVACSGKGAVASVREGRNTMIPCFECRGQGAATEVPRG